MTHKSQGSARRPLSTIADQSAPQAPQQQGAQRYRVLVGISYPTDPRLIAAKLRGDYISAVDYITTRREIGDLASDIPEVCVPFLLAQGVIEPVATPAAPAPAPEPEPADKEGDA